MEKFKVGVWSVGVAAVASVVVQDAGVVSQLKALVLLCAGGNLVALLCAAATKLEEERQTKADAKWLANLAQRK